MNLNQHRAREHLVAAGKIYPGAWKQLDAFRQSRGRDGLPDWPEWCYLPLAASYAVVSGGGSNSVPLHLLADVARLGALAAWRPTQGIYRFDETLYQSLIDTPVTGELPVEVLYHLPEWCVYIETPSMQWGASQIAGFFAHLEWDANTGREELRLLLDLTVGDGYPLIPVPIHLVGSLQEGVDSALAETRRQGWRAKWPDVATASQLVPPDLPLSSMISLLLYLCAEGAEVGDGTERPSIPRPKRTKQGWRLFPAKKPREWEVGVRLGAALRQAYLRNETGQEGGEEKLRPRAHIRRAHWHTYRHGPGRELARLRWLPPIPVNVDGTEELPSTVRTVR